MWWLIVGAPDFGPEVPGSNSASLTSLKNVENLRVDRETYPLKAKKQKHFFFSPDNCYISINFSMKEAFVVEKTFLFLRKELIQTYKLGNFF